MAIGSAPGTRFGEAWTALNALIEGEGSAREPHARLLSAAGASTRDIADAVHCLCMLHGRHPGVIDHAGGRSPDTLVGAWLADAAHAFGGERAALVRVVAASGPLPSTPGQAESETAITAQRHALDMLGASDRAGCPVGAAMALLLDWPTVRLVLDVAAERFGVTLPASTLPTDHDGATLVATLAESPAFERAMLFGAQQLLAQHRALWQLLEARAEARGGY